MPELSKEQKDAIIARRGNKSDKDGKTHRTSTLVIHHKNRKPTDNRPKNLRVLTDQEHKDLHKRAKK